MSSDLTPIQSEAARQFEICNACRYCEGYCAVFPAMFRERVFSRGDVTQLANLCHNCRGCYYACQYTEPHEFALNLPGILAEARSESWELFAWPPGLARTFQRHGVALAVLLVLSIAAIFFAMSAIPGNSVGFYAHLSHAGMVAIFLPAFVLPLLTIAISLRRYWRAVGGEALGWRDLAAAGRDIGTLKNLGGGQGQGCNFELEDQYSNARRFAHQAVFWGFMLCLASTIAGTIMHYAFDRPAPYGPLSLPKLLGVPGGLLLVIGAGWLTSLKIRAEASLGDASVWGGEVAFTLLLGLTGVTGLALYWATGTSLVQPLLALHLGSVLAFFLTMPFSKMAHGFYRTAALARGSQTHRRN